MSDLKMKVRDCLLEEFLRDSSAMYATKKIRDQFGHDALCYSTAVGWFRRFRNGDFSLQDRCRAERRARIDNQHLLSLIRDNPTRTCHSLAQQLMTSCATVQRRLNSLGMKYDDNKRWIYTGNVQQPPKKVVSDQIFSTMDTSKLSVWTPAQKKELLAKERAMSAAASSSKNNQVPRGTQIPLIGNASQLNNGFNLPGQNLLMLQIQITLGLPLVMLPRVNSTQN